MTSDVLILDPTTRRSSGSTGPAAPARRPGPLRRLWHTRHRHSDRRLERNRAWVREAQQAPTMWEEAARLTAR